jgi:hypothetical protein
MDVTMDIGLGCLRHLAPLKQIYNRQARFLLAPIYLR